MLSSTPAPQDELALTLVTTGVTTGATAGVEVRARFLAVASTVAAEIGPRPAASFSQVDLTDLPALLGQALGAVDLGRRLAAPGRRRSQDGAAPFSGTAAGGRRRSPPR